MNFSISKKDFYKHELLELEIMLNGSISSAKYLSVAVSNDSLKVLPLKHYYEKENIPKHFIVPCIDMPFSMIMKYRKLDRLNLLFLVDTRNPHILNAIQSFT